MQVDFDNRDFIDGISRGLASEDFHTRESANTALLAYDIGRAKTEEEKNNARKEWSFRMWAFTCQYGLKDALKTWRKHERSV